MRRPAMHAFPVRQKTKRRRARADFGEWRRARSGEGFRSSVKSETNRYSRLKKEEEEGDEDVVTDCALCSNGIFAINFTSSVKVELPKK